MKKLQQSKTAQLFNFFKILFNESKKCRKKSYFRISLDLFQLVTFGTNYGLQTVNEIRHTLPEIGSAGYFVPLAAKRFLELIDSLVFFSANLAFQNTLGTIVQRIGIRRFWRPLCGGNEAKNLCFWVRWSVCARNVCMSKASMHRPAYFRDNILHLFWRHGR